jgi:hypothetical protein
LSVIEHPSGRELCEAIACDSIATTRAFVQRHRMEPLSSGTPMYRD